MILTDLNQSIETVGKLKKFINQLPDDAKISCIGGYYDTEWFSCAILEYKAKDNELNIQGGE